MRLEEIMCKQGGIVNIASPKGEISICPYLFHGQIKCKNLQLDTDLNYRCNSKIQYNTIIIENE